MRTQNNDCFIKPLALVTALAASSFSASAFSAVVSTPSLDFNINAPTSGTISYGGGLSSALMGADIQVDNVVGLGAPANDGVTLDCILCVLNFNTGNYTGASGNQWFFDGGGSISITGTLAIDQNNDGTPDVVNQILLSGTFNQASTVSYDLGVFNFNIAAGTFADNKNADLLAYYGLPAGDYLGGMNISFTTAAGATPNAGDAFTSTQVGSGDILNTPVPLPTALWMLGGGLLVLTGFARRRG